jgi:hypothetical protein
MRIGINKMKFKEYIKNEEQVDEGALSWLAGTIVMGIQTTWHDIMDKMSKEKGDKEVKQIKKAKDKKSLLSVMKKISSSGKKFPPAALNLIKSAFDDAKYVVGLTVMGVQGAIKDIRKK